MAERHKGLTTLAVQMPCELVDLEFDSSHLTSFDHDHDHHLRGHRRDTNIATR